MAMRLHHGTDELEEVHGFMVAGPLATVDIAVDLPLLQCRAAAEAGQAHLSHAQTGSDAHHRRQGGRHGQRASALDSATLGNKDDRIFLRADRGVRYGDVMAAMNKPRAANYLKVALVGLKIRRAK